MNLKDRAQSIQQRLLNISKKNGDNFQNVVTNFVIERMLARILADASLAKALVFKGGYVGLRVYSSPRYTVDLDALIKGADVKKTVSRARDAIENGDGDAVWFRFEEELNLQTQGEYGGVRLSFRAGIGEPMKNLKRAQIVNFDMGIGDPVTPGPIASTLKPILEGEDLSWQVYPVETIAAEKIHSLVALRELNSRSKDIFDLAHFLPLADKRKLKAALKATFEFRDTALPEDLAADLGSIDLRVLRVGWVRAVASVSSALSCEAAFAKVLECLVDL